MADAAIFLVVDLIADVLRAYAPLAGFTVRTDLVEDETVEDTKAISIEVLGTKHNQPPMQGQTEHAATIEFGVLDDKDTPGIITRNNAATIAHVIAALNDDYAAGRREFSYEPVDSAGSSANGRDVASSSLQCRVTFNTPSDDWFTILTD